MNVLVTNTRVYGRGGSESFLRELVRGLQSRGHSVLVYSNDAVPADAVPDDILPVASDLEALPFRPDILHAQHHLDAMTALAALPGVPALYHCHGAVWRECPPAHPRIYHYLTVSRTLAERMAVESSLSASDITVLLNSVDIDRFRLRRALPSRPARALFFNNRHGEGSDTLAAIREAVSRRGLALDCVGAPFGTLISQPETILPEYDVVFASGRSAIEAIACGCAVIVLGRAGCGGMVTPETFDRFRDVNFTIAVNSPPPSADAIAVELDRFSAPAVTQVSERLRREADFRDAVDRLLPIYEQVVARHRAAAPDPTAESLAMMQYLRRIVPLVKMMDRMQEEQWPSQPVPAPIRSLRRDLAGLRERVEETAPR